MLDSGHGGQTKDLDGDEADGFDEGCFYFVYMIDLADTNDVHSYLSCKLLARLHDTDVSPTDVNKLQMDFEANGHIVDDVSAVFIYIYCASLIPFLIKLMHEIMVKPLPAGCRLTAIFDASLSTLITVCLDT